MRKFGLILMCCLFAGCGTSSRSGSLELEQTIRLPNVKGGFDLMAVDVEGKRLFLAGEDNNTVEVIDLAAGRAIQSVGGVHEPKWIVFRPESHKLYVSNGGDGAVRVFDSKTFQPLKTIEFKEKSNNLRFDAATGLLYVGVGKTFGEIAIIDTKTDTVVGRIPLAAFPKQFELELNGPRIFVNVPSANHVAVLNRNTRQVVATWPIEGAKGNVPMGYDPAHHRLMVGCESGVWQVIDTDSGKLVATLPIAPEPDGVHYDTQRRLIYVSCGEGEVDVIRQIDADHYERAGTIPTAKGAATSMWSSQMKRFYLAVPQREGQEAALRVYRPVE